MPLVPSPPQCQERNHRLPASSRARIRGGGDLILPADVEPYGPGDSEYRAGQRLLARVRQNLGARFINYVVVDGEFATAPFLHAAGKAGWPVVARLKENLPELLRAAEKRFRSRPPAAAVQVECVLEFRDGTDRVEIWDVDDFDPWESLQWETVRVLRYRQHKPDGDVVEAYWLTDLSSRNRPNRRSSLDCRRIKGEYRARTCMLGGKTEGVERTDDIVRGLREEFVSMCARLCGKRAAKGRAKNGVEARPCA